MDGPRRMRDRTFDLHRAIVKEFRRVHPADDAERVLWHELLRTATSIATNSAESDGAQSRREFVMKFQITLKEAREALQLLRLLRDCCANRDRQLEACWTSAIKSRPFSSPASRLPSGATRRRAGADGRQLPVSRFPVPSPRFPVRGSSFAVHGSPFRSPFPVPGSPFRSSSFVLSSSFGTLGPRALHFDLDMPPLALPEAQHAQHAAREVTEHDREPDVGRLQTTRRLDDGAHADRNRDL